MKALLVVLLGALLTACDHGPAPEPPGGAGAMGGMTHTGMAGGVDTTGLRSLDVPAEHEQGRAFYEATCAACHGEAGLGTAQGPPLIHIVYEPNHHADAAFLLAAQRGVRAHHWRFGDMPPQPAVTPEQVAEITAYVRWLQREAGVY